MRGLKRAGGVAALAAALAVSGCAAMFGGYDLAPDGLPRGDASIRQGLADAPASTHDAVIDGERELPDDDLLRLLYAGTTGRYAGRHRESSQYLDLAGYVAEDRVTTSVSQQALSFITSDRALDYVPSPTERLMIPYVAALNYLEVDDVGGAVVEARRIEALLDQLDEGVPRDQVSADSRFLHLFAAAIFDAAGDRNAADVAYRRAGAGSAAVETPAAYAAVPADSMGAVVVLVERGFVPHRVEQSVVILLPPVQVQLLTDGDAGEKAAAAAEAAARVLIHAAQLYGDRSPYYFTDSGYRRDVRLSPWRDRCGDDGRRAQCTVKGFDPYLLRVSWPVLYHDPVPGGALRLDADGVLSGPARRLDVSAGVRRDFEDAWGRTLSRAIFRAATKMALSASAESAVSERDEAAGRIVGLLVNLGTLLTERADTRSWHLLPGTVDMVRMRLPAGRHDLSVEAEGWRARDVDLGTVEVRPGRTTFVVRRVWR